MLRWLIESQALPSLMWIMVGQSLVLLAVLLYLVSMRLALARPVGERACQKALETFAELAPMTGILGTVCGFSFGLHHLDAADARAFVVEGLRTAMYTTAYGLVLAISALLARQLYPWTRR